MAFGFPTSFRRALPPALPAAFTALSLALGACASPAPAGPAWPEQSTPAYPGTTETRAEANPARPATPAPSADSHSELAKTYAGKAAIDVLEGKASYYADSLAGNHTANGDVYQPAAYTAAHKKLPFGTVVRVVRVDDGKVTYAKINDRGPFGPADRIIDLSRAAASELDMMRAGVVEVRVEVLEKPVRK
jgi:rare lipoprotein A